MTATSKTTASGGLMRAKALSIEIRQPQLPNRRNIAILAADGVNAGQVNAVLQALTAAGSKSVVVGPHLGSLGNGIEATMTFKEPNAAVPEGGEAAAREANRGMP